MTYTINVTEEDIKNGVAGRCHQCPVALAMFRVLEKPLDLIAEHNPVRVTGPEVSIFYKDFSTKRYRLSKLAQYFVNDFDWHRKEKVKPFSFIFSTHDIIEQMQ